MHPATSGGPDRRLVLGILGSLPPALYLLLALALVAAPSEFCAALRPSLPSCAGNCTFPASSSVCGVFLWFPVLLSLEVFSIPLAVALVASLRGAPPRRYSARAGLAFLLPSALLTAAAALFVAATGALGHAAVGTVDQDTGMGLSLAVAGLLTL